jgi:hypothetical protein
MLLDCTAAKEFWSQASLRLAKGVKVSRLNTTTWASDLLSDICPKPCGYLAGSSPY